MKKLLYPATVLFAAVGLLALAALPCAAQPHYGPKWESLDQRPCPAWYQDEEGSGAFQNHVSKMGGISRAD